MPWFRPLPVFILIFCFSVFLCSCFFPPFQTVLNQKKWKYSTTYFWPLQKYNSLCAWDTKSEFSLYFTGECAESLYLKDTLSLTHSLSLSHPTCPSLPHSISFSPVLSLSLSFFHFFSLSLLPPFTIKQR